MIQNHINTFIANYLIEKKLDFDDWTVNQNTNKDFGEFSSNLALKLAKHLKKSPIEIAENIVKESAGVSEIFKLSASAPGFINFHISDQYYYTVLKKILKEGENFGKKRTHNKKANVEFVSSNPTGPLTVGHGRQAILGDIISNILTWDGYRVTREYYYNDAGKQMRVLAESCYAKYAALCGKNVPFPENGYVGSYIDKIAQKILDLKGASLKPEDKIFREFTENEIFTDIQNTLNRIGVKFDVFSKEGQFYSNGSIDKILEFFAKNNLSYVKDGAVWFKTSHYGKEEDKVLVKSTGEPTYRLPDIAYHADKVDRGFDLIVDVFGADHIDTYPDVILGLECLNKKTDHIKVIIHQFVTLKKGGEIVKMSTRKANFVTLDELVDDLSPDIIRYFFIMRGASSHLDFDLDLAKDDSEKNPAYYLQYAHARISNLLKRYSQEMGDNKVDTNYENLKSQDELNLLKILSDFPDTMNDIVSSLEPRRLATYLEEVAAAYHKFYGNQKVINPADIKTSTDRKDLCRAAQIILKIGLSILGISCPERM